MADDIVLPNVGFDMTEGKIVTWHIAIGDPVGKGEPLVDVETDKATVEVPSTAEGVLLEQLFSEGDTVEVGTVIARVGESPGAT